MQLHAAIRDREREVRRLIEAGERELAALRAELDWIESLPSPPHAIAAAAAPMAAPVRAEAGGTTIRDRLIACMAENGAKATRELAAMVGDGSADPPSAATVSSILSKLNKRDKLVERSPNGLWSIRAGAHPVRQRGGGGGTGPGGRDSGAAKP